MIILKARFGLDLRFFRPTDLIQFVHLTDLKGCIKLLCGEESCK